MNKLVNGKDLRPQRYFGYLCIGLGLMLILASFNSTWGTAYGQTVPTPTPWIPGPDPRCSKTVDPGCIEPGDMVTYTIIVTNIGDVNATNVVVTDTIPVEFILHSVSTTKGTWTINGNYFEVNIGTVAPGEIVTITVVAEYMGGAPPNTIIINTSYLIFDGRVRECSVGVEVGPCKPPILPPTGDPVPEPEGGTSLWLLAAGLLVLLLGIVLTVGSRRRRPPEES